MEDYIFNQEIEMEIIKDITVTLLKLILGIEIIQTGVDIVRFDIVPVSTGRNRRV